MDLRTRTTHALAGTGALLIVVGLSVGGGVAMAAPGVANQTPAGVKATATSSDNAGSGNQPSDKKSERRSSKNRRSRRGSNSTDPSGNNSTTDSTGTDPSNDSTATSATTATSTPSAPMRPTPTTSPPTTATTTPTTTATTSPTTTATTTPPPTAESNGQYNGRPYQATEAPTGDSTSTTTVPPGRAARAPVNRSGSNTPATVNLFDRGDNSANSSSGPDAPSAPSTPAAPLPAPVATAESRPSQPAANPTGAGAAGDPGSATAPSPASASEVSGAGAKRRDAGAAAGPRQLGQTGAGTRRLMFLGGLALLLGAVVVAFTSRERPAAAVAPLPVGPARRPRPRKELDGWEDGVPLAPAKRELARHRLGIGADSRYGVSVESYYADEPEA